MMIKDLSLFLRKLVGSEKISVRATRAMCFIRRPFAGKT